MTTTNVQIRLAARPQGLPKASDFEVVEEKVRPPREGEVLVENLYLSLDPAIRGWMNEGRSYVPPIKIGQVMRGYVAGRVVESSHEAYAPGDRVTGVLGWQGYATVQAKHLVPIPAEVPTTLAMGPLGMTGMTAYFGLLDVGRPREGEGVLVSGAAGAVGSLVGQIALLKGCRVVGLAGSDEKCRWIRDDLGFHHAINYKTSSDLRDALGAAFDGAGVDVYFDNVGGEILDLALAYLNRRGRVVICGAVSQYNATERAPGPANYLSLLINRARMEGFIVTDYAECYAEAYAELSGWIRDGRIQWREDVVDGLVNAPAALLRLFDGSNTGKLLVRIRPED